MTWARFDDGYAFHPKVKPLSDRAFRLWHLSVSYSAQNLTDGAITAGDVRMLCAAINATKKHVAELMHAGLWDRAADGYVIHDYLEFNPTREKVLAGRKANAERQRKHRDEQGRNPDGTFGNAPRNALRNAVTDDTRNGVRNTAPSRPVEVKTLADEIERMRRKAEAKAQ